MFYQFVNERTTNPSRARNIRSTGNSRGWGPPWIPEEINMLRAAYTNGDNLIALAHRIGRSNARSGGRRVNWV
jgi:hypothetical protein